MKGKMMVVVAILLGAVVVYLVNSQFSELEAKTHVATRTFYRAAANIPPGGTVKAALDDSHLLQPVTDVPETFAKGYPDAVDKEIQWAKPLTISRPIRAGEFLMMTHLQPLSTEELRSRIPEGHETITISVSAETSVGYLVAPGDVVDVTQVVTKNDVKAPGGVVIEPVSIATDVLVFAVDSLVASPSGTTVRPRGVSYATVTLAAPHDAWTKLMAARQAGKLTLVLKSKKSG